MTLFTTTTSGDISFERGAIDENHVHPTAV